MRIEVTPAGWAAFAATCSTVLSVVMLLIQRRNLHAAARPELVITGWSRASEDAHGFPRDVIVVKGIKNVGRGVALNAHYNAVDFSAGNTPKYLGDIIMLPTVAVDEEVPIGDRIILFWQNAPAEAHFLAVDVVLTCWDGENVRHTVRYSVFVYRRTSPVIGTGEVAETNVRRVRVSESVRWIELKIWGKTIIPRTTKRIRRLIRRLAP